MQPTIGRTVHYVNLGDKEGKYPTEIQAAMVTGVYIEDDFGIHQGNGITDKPNSMFVDLKAFYRSGFFDMQRVPFSETYQPGHWSWPPRG